jgi:hypothetical protein
LGEEALLAAQPELKAERINGVRVQTALKPGDQQENRVAGHQPGEQEVQRHGSPEGRKVKANSAQKVLHLRLL